MTRGDGCQPPPGTLAPSVLRDALHQLLHFHTFFFLCMCVHMSLHACGGQRVKLVSSSVASHFTFWRQGFSLNPKLIS